MSAIHINLADHFAWAVFLQRTLSLCEGFAAEYRYVPSLVIAGVFFTLIRLLRERISIRWLGPTSAITSPNRRPMHLTIHSDSPAQRMTAHREAHTFNNQLFLNSLILARALPNSSRRVGHGSDEPGSGQTDCGRDRTTFWTCHRTWSIHPMKNQGVATREFQGATNATDFTV